MLVTDKASFLSIQQLDFGYGNRSIFTDFSLEIPAKKITALMGSSGCGKTTLLRLISGQLTAQRGKILLAGQDVVQMTQKQLYAIRRKMGMLFQFGALFTDLTVFENVAFPLREHTALSERMIHDIVLMKLEAVGLRGCRDLRPDEISGGMARRVALARAIALDPALIMYDEPFTGLDPIALGTSAQLIKELCSAMGLTSIVVSHNIEDTFLIADHVVLLSEGKVVAQGTAEQIKHSQHPWVRQFIHGEKDGPVHFHYPAPALATDFLDA